MVPLLVVLPLGVAFVIELEFLSGRDQLAGAPVASLITY